MTGMDRTFATIAREIAQARTRLAAIDWRAVLRRGAILAALLGRGALVLAGSALVLAGWILVLAQWAAPPARRVVHIARRSGVRLGHWALRRPRTALGVGLAVSLAAASVVVLWPAPRRPAPRLDLSASLDCLALNIYHEARGEPLEGKIAVGQVVMNRVGDPDFPAAVCEVVKQGGERPHDRCQFSWWCDGLSDRPDDAGAWEDSKGLAGKILAGGLEDPTRGALWYHADHVAPRWKMDMVRQGKIGRHVFYVRQSR